VLTVARPLEFSVSVEFQSDGEQARLHCERSLERARTKLAGESLSKHFHYVIGHPAEQIVRYAEAIQVDHIVVGHRGDTKFDRLLIGSVARQVFAYANCTVTVVRTATP
jgi:nucleotide-binding universal stress UspA family protein